jgi:preprotein translocase subunit YajC
MNFYALTAGATAANSSSSTWIIILLYVAIFGGLYFFLIRPQQQKKKKEDKMRGNVQIGDDITTIGGIVGRVVGIKEDSDTIVIETGTDRAKIRIKRWAVGSVDTIHDNAE